MVSKVSKDGGKQLCPFDKCKGIPVNIIVTPYNGVLMCSSVLVSTWITSLKPS